MAKLKILFFYLLVFTIVYPLHSAKSTSCDWLKSYHYPNGTPSGIATHNGVIYLPNIWSRGDGILCFDARNLEDIHFSKGLPSTGYLTGCTFKDNIMYATSKFSLMVIDISQPEKPKLIRNMLMGFPKMGAMVMAVAGDYLLLGGMGCGVRTFDISEPSSPLLMENYPQYKNVTEISAAGKFIYIASRRQNSIIAEIIDGKITVLSTLKIKGKCKIIENKKGTFSAVLFNSRTKKTIIYKLNTQTKPLLASELLAEKIIGKLTQTKYLFSSKDNQLTVFDLVNPSKPVKIRKITFPKEIIISSAVTKGDLLFILDSLQASLLIFDVSGVEAREIKKIHILRNESTFEIVKGRSIHFLISQTYRPGISQILSIKSTTSGEVDFSSKLTMPKLKNGAFYKVNDVLMASASKTINSYLLIGDGLIDIANPDKMHIIKAPTRMAASIRIKNGKAFLSQKDRITILDVSKLPKLSTIGVFVSPEKGTHYTDAIPDKNILYLVNRLSKYTKIEVLDISNPANPKLLGNCKVAKSITAALYKNYLYVPISQPNQIGMSIIDISIPKKPTLIKTIPGIVTTACYKIKVYKGALFLTDSMRGLKRINITDPLRPKLTNTYTGSIDITSSYTDFEFCDDKLYGLRHSQIDVWKLN